MSAVGKVVHLWKYLTKTSGFSVTPGCVRAGGKVTVSGRLWQKKGKWAPDTRQRMVTECRYGKKAYTLRHGVMTDSAGRFHQVFALPQNAVCLAW